MQENEIWKNIPKYNGYYSVSNMGRIRSNSRLICKSDGNNQTIKERILNQNSNGNGYMCVYLCVNRKKKMFTVHRLVANAFVLNPKGKPTVNHKNGIKNDNRSENLEYNTISENIKHAYDNGLRKSYMKGKFGIKSVNSRPVLQYSKDGILINTFAGQMEASRETLIDNSSIAKACIGKAHTAGNYIWKFK